jgi:PTH1 family peptidyl-tRNA hydrolase
MSSEVYGDQPSRGGIVEPARAELGKKRSRSAVDGHTMNLLKSLFTRSNSHTSIDHEDSQEMPPEPNTRLIVGLGNPGSKYANTRHNAGFFVIDELARRIGAPASRKRFKGEISEARRGEGRFVLIQPQTYMNESGVTVRETVRWYKTPLDRVLIVVDDLDIPFGEVRLRSRGSAGGHNGLKSIFGLMGTQEISRLRVGIGRGNHARAAIGHVLSRFSPEEEANLDSVIARAADIVELWADRGVVEAMNIANDPANQPLVSHPGG